MFYADVVGIIKGSNWDKIPEIPKQLLCKRGNLGIYNYIKIKSKSVTSITTKGDLVFISYINKPC